MVCSTIGEKGELRQQRLQTGSIDSDDNFGRDFTVWWSLQID
jgi:hypothetical protein